MTLTDLEVRCINNLRDIVHGSRCVSLSIFCCYQQKLLKRLLYLYTDYVISPYKVQVCSPKTTFGVYRGDKPHGTHSYSAVLTGLGPCQHQCQMSFGPVATGLTGQFNSPGG